MEKNYGHRSRRKIVLAFALLASSVVALASTTTSSVQAATSPITLTAPRLVKKYVSNRSEWLPSFSVKNNTSFNLVVGVSFTTAPKGTKFSIGQKKGLTLKYGYSGWTNRTSLAFSGKASDINRALASMKLHAAGPGKVTIKVSATADDTPLAYEPISSHYYGFIEARGITWTDALAAASKLSFRDTPAYLAAITTADENDFVSYNIENAANAWIGATDKDVEGEFKWVTGESAGKTFWKAACAGATGADACTGANNVNAGVPSGWAGTYLAKVSDNPAVNTYSSWDRTAENTNADTLGNFREPNNWGGDEDYVVTNWKGSVGLWNDMPNAAGNNPGVSGYIVEYAGPPGKPFTGVVEATASYRVFADSSEFAPREVSVSKSNPSMGEVAVRWLAPQYKNQDRLAKNKVRVKQYYVTSSVRPGEKFCVEPDMTKRRYICGISGFMPGEELYLTVHAVYTKPPKGGGFFKRGQSTFGVADEDTPFDTVAPFIFSVQRDRQVRDGAITKIVASGLKPGSTITVTANGSTVVYRGTATADGTVPASASVKFPAKSLVAGNDWSVATYTLDATRADGTVRTQHVSLIFYGQFYWWSTFVSSTAPIWTWMTVVPHTAVVN